MALVTNSVLHDLRGYPRAKGLTCPLAKLLEGKSSSKERFYAAMMTAVSEVRMNSDAEVVENANFEPDEAVALMSLFATCEGDWALNDE